MIDSINEKRLKLAGQDLADWHVITCEYPPEIGGVSDYTFLMARELAKTGDAVHVWCGGVPSDGPQSFGVTLHRELGRFSPRDLVRAGKLLDQFPAPRWLFVQWVPHGYGYRSVNIFFCLWLWTRARFKQDHVHVMFHEVCLSFGISWKANLAAVVHRMMVAFLKRAACRIWISCEAWREYFRDVQAPVGLLPVPSSIPCNASRERVAALRKRFCDEKNTQLIGHLGIGDAAVTNQLRRLLPALLRENQGACFLLIGKASEKFAQQIQCMHPDIAKRIFASGVLPTDEISSYISACDLMIQPYVDGISTRRTAAMAVLSNGSALLTTSGHSTETFWLDCRQLAIVPADDFDALIERARQLLNDDKERARMADDGRELYQALFGAPVSVQILQGKRPSLNVELFKSCLGNSKE